MPFLLGFRSQFLKNGIDGNVIQTSERSPQRDELLPLEELERRAILRTLRETDGDKLAASRLLGIGKTTLYRKLKQYKLDQLEA